MVQGSLVLSGETCPHHDRASAIESHVLHAVLVEPLARAPPNPNANVRVDQGEPGLITEANAAPLATVPVPMARGPRPASGQVGCCVLGTPVGDAGMRLDLLPTAFMVAHSDVGGHPKLPPDEVGYGGA